MTEQNSSQTEKRSPESPDPIASALTENFEKEYDERWTAKRIGLLALITVALIACMLGGLSLLLKLAAHGFSF